MKIIKLIKKYLRKVFLVTNPVSPYPLFYDFRMSKSEIALFDKHLKKSKHYLEFGLGGSTLRALQKSSAKINSVESSRDWVEKMKNYKYIKKRLNNRINIHQIDIGKTQNWGYPIENSKKNLFPHFSEKVFECIASEKLDTVLIDGRFRVACTLKTIIKCHKNKNLVILIHDYFDRTHYHVVEEFLDLNGKADTLGVFKIKKDLDLKQVEKLYDEYKFNPA